MKPQMHRKFIALVASAAIALTAFGSVPARADDDVLRALAAIAGIAIVGKVIHDRTKDRRGNQGAVQRSTGQVFDTTPLLGVAPRPLPDRAKKANRRLLPGECLRSTETWDGRVRYFGQRCLQRNYQFANRLPQACAVRVRGQNGIRRGYEARCLRNEGYQLARN